MRSWPFNDLEPGKYGAIVADPPWSFKSNSKARPGRNAMRHYETMSLEEIEALPVKDLAADNCALFLWITSPFLAIGAHIAIGIQTFLNRLHVGQAQSEGTDSVLSGKRFAHGRWSYDTEER